MHPRLLASFVVVLLVAVAAFGFRANADAQKTSTQGHPLIGTWIADTDPEASDNAMDTLSFTADGTFTDVGAGGFVAPGVWESTGDRTAHLSIMSYELDEEGNNLGSTMIRVSIEVSDDGNRFTAEYAIEFVQAD